VELAARQRNGYFSLTVRGGRGAVRSQALVTLADLRALTEFAEEADLARRVTRHATELT
jgi:hypothetical protein